MDRVEHTREEQASAVIEQLLSSSAREALLPIFADSIERAHEGAANKWGVTVARDRVRLNVGMVVVCTIHRGMLWLALEGTHDLPPLPPPPGWAYNGPYRGFPDMTEVYVLPHLHELTPAAQRAHWHLIDHAKEKYTKLRAQAEGSHNDGFLTYLERTLRREMPRPLY